MELLPAVDLLDGRVVRLAQGRREAVTVYSTDPVAMAQQWVDAGATWLHVVDLNGAFDGTYTNLAVAEAIIRRCPVRVELSGGIRTRLALSDALGIGPARVVLGTTACEDPAFVQDAAARYGTRIAVAIDARDGQVVSRGWVAATSLTPQELTRRVVSLGVTTVICTDVSRDGMLQGPNLDLLRDVLAVGPTQVIASGGIASVDDLKVLKALEAQGLAGAIVGKALYEGAIKIGEALAILG